MSILESQIVSIIIIYILLKARISFYSSKNDYFMKKFERLKKI